MKFFKHAFLAAAVLVAFSAQASVSGTLGGGTGTFLSLSTAGLDGGAVASLSGGTVYSAHHEFAALPPGPMFGGTFLAAGPTSGSPATLTFASGGVDYVSFLWSSPDTYNVLTVNSTGGGSQAFTAMDMGFAVTNGDRSFAQYVQFAGVAGSKITSLAFNTSPAIDAFETANYSVTAVPEPETYLLMLAGMAALGYVARRRGNQA